MQDEIIKDIDNRRYLPRRTLDRLINDMGYDPEKAASAIEYLYQVNADGDTTWRVIGILDQGDHDEILTVEYAKGVYSCSCGKKKCVHVVAVIAADMAGTVNILPKSKRLPYTPEMLGMPAKFSEFRDIQLVAIQRILDSKKPYIVIQGPTGSGKSLIAAAAQRVLKKKMLYIAFTKQLQGQFVNDFEFDRDGKTLAVELRGRANYPTARYPHRFPYINASMCTGHKQDHCRYCCDGNCGHTKPCFGELSSSYRMQKMKAIESRLAVLNFDIFVNEANYIGGFSNKFGVVCIDEADMIERGLMGFVQLSITRKWIDKLGLPLPERKTVEASWLKWAKEVALPSVALELHLLKNEYGVEDMRREEELKRMLTKIKYFLDNIGTEDHSRWVFIAEEDKWTWKPIFISSHAKANLWRHSDKFILMSATIVSCDEFSYNLGIPREEIDFIDLPSSFHKSNRPIYYMPAATVTKKEEKTSRADVIKAMDGILDKYPDSKVLCHATSYGFAAEVMRSSRHKKRLITYDSAKNRALTLMKFKRSKLSQVLVASSMERGIDLPEDECRVVIVLKVPFLNLGDKQVNQRLYSDKRGGQMWYAVNAIRTLVQETGRGVRSEDDTCDIYILDGSFGRLYRENKYLFPAWWREALKQI